MALGASRSQLLRLVLTETTVLVVAGSIAGMIFAEAFLGIFIAWAPVRLPRLEEIQIDWIVLLFFVAAIALCTILCGLLPALRLSRIDPQQSLKSRAVAAEYGRNVRCGSRDGEGIYPVCVRLDLESLGLRPSIGRLFTEGDNVQPGAHPYAVLSHEYWTRPSGQIHKWLAARSVAAMTSMRLSAS